MTKKIFYTVMELYKIYLEGTYKVPEDFHIFRYQVDDSGDNFILTGSVCPLYKIGSKKGSPNYKKADKSTKKVFTFSIKDFEDWRINFLTVRNICLECSGKGDVFVRWEKDSGSTYKSCPKCLGTGKK